MFSHNLSSIKLNEKKFSINTYTTKPIWVILWLILPKCVAKPYNYKNLNINNKLTRVSWHGVELDTVRPPVSRLDWQGGRPLPVGEVFLVHALGLHGLGGSYVRQFGRQGVLCYLLRVVVRPVSSLITINLTDCINFIYLIYNFNRLTVFCFNRVFTFTFKKICYRYLNTSK